MKYIVLLSILLVNISCKDSQGVGTEMLNKSTALLIIDVQNDYFPGGNMELVGADAAGAKTKELLEYYRKNNMPVVHIQHIATQAGATFFLPNTKGAEISSYVTPLKGEKVITKHYPNSFRETELKEYLESKGIKNLVITGMMTDVCVDATTRAAMDLGYNNTIISDASATRDRELSGIVIPAAEIHNSFLGGLNALNSLYAKIMTTDEYLKK